MQIRVSRKNFVILLGMMFALLMLPAYSRVYAQNANATQTTNQTAEYQVATEPPPTEGITDQAATDSAESVQSTSPNPSFTLDASGATITGDPASVTPSMNPDGGDTAQFTPTPTQATVIPTQTQVTNKKSPDCVKRNVFDWQITVGYHSAQFPEPGAAYVKVDGFDGADGLHIGVIQVDEADFCQTLLELRKKGGVDYAEPNYSVSSLETIPSDPNLSNQYYLYKILAPQGWDLTTGSPAVTIAIIDTGIDLNHVDLAGKVVAGYDFVDEDTIPQDENGHGTIVAGIAAAATNNGVGVAGVSWGAQIMPLRVLDSAGNGSYTDVAEAVIWATDHGARVINMSLGGSNYSSTLHDAVAYAVSQGVVVVAATGNTGASSVLYPAAFPGVVGVGATNSANQLASFSNTGSGVDVVAPGVSIYSSYPGNLYQYSSGTSMASPQVAGFASLLLSLPATQYSNDVVNLIESSALDLGAPGWDSQYGFGLIQIGPAILSVTGQNKTATPSPTGSKPQTDPTFTPSATKTKWVPLPASTNVPPWQNPYQSGPTATPGEVYALQTSSLGGSNPITPTDTATPTVNGLATGQAVSTPQDEPKVSWPFLILIGVLCLGVSACLYIYYRKKY